jgi:Retrotransposon gag protein
MSIDWNIVLFQMVHTRLSSRGRGSPPPEARSEAGGVGRTTAAQPAVSVEPIPTVAASGVADPVISRPEVSQGVPVSTVPVHSQPTVRQLLMQVVQLLAGGVGDCAETSAGGAARGAHPPPIFIAPVTEATVVATGAVQGELPAVTTTVETAMVPVLPLTEVRKTLAQFLQLAPVRFSGAAGQDPCRFLDIAEERLRTLGVLQSHGAEFIAYVLEGDADEWFRTMRSQRAFDAAPLTWTEFCTSFRARFIPYSVRESLRTQFEGLRWEGISFSEYESRFTRLSRYAPDLVATEEAQIRRFLIGVPVEVRRECRWMVLQRSSFQEVVDFVRQGESLPRQGQGASGKRQRIQGQYSGSRFGDTRRGGSSQSHGQFHQGQF